MIKVFLKIKLPAHTEIGYELKFTTEQSDWPTTCTEKNSRKKRRIPINGIIPLQYSYINVVIDVQFTNETVTYDDVK